MTRSDGWEIRCARGRGAGLLLVVGVGVFVFQFSQVKVDRMKNGTLGRIDIAGVESTGALSELAFLNA